MALEIERKFLVDTAIWRRPEGGVRMRQGYVPTKDGATVRVRIAGDRAYLTLKDHAVGITRHEFEYEIPLADAETLLDTMCAKPQVDKVRHRISAAEPGLFWEVDEFLGDNAPLVTAEIELPSEDTPFTKPAWLGADVTDDHRYKNSSLASAPYSAWGRMRAEFRPKFHRGEIRSIYYRRLLKKGVRVGADAETLRKLETLVYFDSCEAAIAGHWVEGIPESLPACLRERPAPDGERVFLSLCYDPSMDLVWDLYFDDADELSASLAEELELLE